MNSMYGKIIIKPVEADTIVKDEKYNVENMYIITIIILIQ